MYNVIVKSLVWLAYVFLLWFLLRTSQVCFGYHPIRLCPYNGLSRNENHMDRASLQTQEQLWQRDFSDGAKLRHSDLESGASYIRYVLCHTLAQRENLINRQERGLEPTEAEVNIQEWGLEFSAPNPLGQERRLDDRCVWTTCVIPDRCCSYYTV